ncbi:family with sequence similarity 186 member B [Rhinolophus ferrumequinum]|uniref:Family with sequence similarity 186 member B n=1 Tax=Rhinolophus ferrumequinum TaxID=59479 RepID=A0A7J7WPL8_RHIFE|nr:family with sequence similarity 186 member B [Rhinolophus ferrumequinum]
MEKDKPPQLVTPTSVTAIISRIEAAQLTRAQEDISSQLSDILDNVNCVINRFQEELGYDIKEKAKSHQMEQKGKNRFILLEKIASFSKDAKTKEKHLYEILRWLGDWGDSLTYEIRNRKSEEEEEGLDEWIEVMEKVLPLSLITTKGGIESLISLCSTLIEGQKKSVQRSKHNFWQGWQQESPQKSASFPQPLSPEQMLQDKNTTCTRVSEVKSMLQELLDSTMFNQGEVRAIRYMSTVVENLNKALILQHQENRSLETKYRHLKIEMCKEICSQRLYSQQSLQVLESKRDALLKQVEMIGGKYHDLLLIKHALEFQLKEAQSARGQADDSAKIFVESPTPPEEGTLPEKEPGMEEIQQEPKKEEQLFSPRPTAMARDSGARSSTHPSPSTMTMQWRIADVYSSKDAESLQPVLPSSVDHKFPKKWEITVAESPGHIVKDQKDFFQEAAQEKEGLPMNSHFRDQLSPESSRKVALESKVQRWEEELSWERRRQQWLEEEEMWLQRQKTWALLEQEHQQKLRQWEMEEVAKEQQQRLVQPEKEQGGPQREPEPLREDVDRTTFMTSRQWRDLEKAWLTPPPSRAQSACQGRSPHLPSSPKIQQPTPKTQRITISADFTQKPWTRRVPTKPKKSASAPVTGGSICKVAQPPLHISPITLKGKVYHMDVEAQRKNLQLLSEGAEWRLPHYLRSRALELTATTMGLSVLRLQGLCHKYILYRHFQSLRQEVINHIQALRETGTPYEAQNLYIFLEHTDRLRDLRLQALTDRQKHLEEKRQKCLSSMVTMFPKLQLEWNIHLNTPVLTSPKPRKSKLSSSLHRQVHSSGPSCKQPPENLPSTHRARVPLWMARQQGNQMETVWKTDVASSSHPIEKKTPTSLSWDQLGGCPDIPRLLALDVHSCYHKSLMSLKARASATQRKECREPSEESAELVHKKSSESLPGTLKSQKDRDNHSPHSIP